MKLIEIKSLDIPELEIYRKMRGNAFDADNSFVADSPKVVNMLLAGESQIHSLLATRAYYERYAPLIEQQQISKLYVGEKALIETIVGHTMHHNVMAHGRRPENVPLEAMGKQIIMLDALSNMENVGAVARSAAALGVDSMMLPMRAPHPYGRRAIRVSMGYVTKLKIHRFDSVTETLLGLRSLGYTVYGAEASKDALELSTLDNVPDKWVVIMGNEERGLPEEIMALCDKIIQIEMVPEVKSLNVSIAASIIMYWMKRHARFRTTV